MGEFPRERLLLGVDLTVVGVLELGWRDVSEGAVQPVVVEPVDPVQGAELEVVDATPGSFVADAFQLMETDRALGWALS